MSTDSIHINTNTKNETQRNPRVAQMPEQIVLTEAITPRLRASWIDSTMRMRGILIMNSIENVIEHFARGLWRMVMICIVLHVAGHFAPELKNLLPTVYEFMDGAAMVLETIFRLGLRLMGAIFTGHLFEVQPGINQEFSELLRQFGEWVTSL